MNFYVVANNGLFNDKHFAFTEKVDQVVGEAPQCKYCGAFLSQMEWLPPLTVKLSKPKYGDLMFGGIHPFLVSENFRGRIVEEGLSGIERFREVEIVKVSYKRKNSAEPPRYFLPTVKRSKTRVDEERSGYVRDGEVKCDVCRSGVIWSMDRLYLDEDTWDGLDLFIPIGLPGTVIASERFYEFAQKHQFANLMLTPSEMYRPSWARGKKE